MTPEDLDRFRTEAPAEYAEWRAEPKHAARDHGEHRRRKSADRSERRRHALLRDERLQT